MLPTQNEKSLSDILQEKRLTVYELQKNQDVTAEVIQSLKNKKEPYKEIVMLSSNIWLDIQIMDQNIKILDIIINEHKIITENKLKNKVII